MASSIPNLNTLRRGRGGPRLRGRSGPPVSLGELSNSNSQDEAARRDKIVQGTDNDASSSRLSAVELNYMQDDYVKAFAGTTDASPRRFPIINRGTYVRTNAIDLLVSRFLVTNLGTRKQIISLGAGTDTRFFRLCGNAQQVTYHELDFEANITAKQAAIDRSVLLSTRLRDLQASGTRYCLHPVDLRSFSKSATPNIDGIDLDIPTLLLSECCLCYLTPNDAMAVLEYFAKALETSAGIVLYEPVRPSDAFGRTMISNLASRGIQLQTIRRYATLQSQRERLKLAGFTGGQGARDVYQIWQNDEWISEVERERVERLEWLDEIEEWKLLASHYCIAWAHRGDDFSKAWAGLAGATTIEESKQDAMQLIE